MNILLLVVSLLLTLVAAFVDRRELKPSKANPATLISQFLFLAVGAAAILKLAPPEHRAPLICGLFIGTVITMFLPACEGGSTALVLAIGAFGPAATFIAPEKMIGPIQQGLLIAFGVASLITGSSLVTRAALATSAVVVASALGQSTDGTAVVASAPILLAIAATVALLVARFIPKERGQWKPVLVFIVTALAVAAIGFGWLNDKAYAGCLGLGLLAAVVVQFTLPSDDSQPFRFILGGVVWVALATVAFGIGRSYGIALSALSATAYLLCVGCDRALLTLGPLLSVVLYRWFREIHPDASRSLDIGQHYTIVGLLLGALIPTLPVEWSNGRPIAKASAGGVLWAILLLAVPASLVLVISVKGLAGYLVGLGLAPLFRAREDATLHLRSLAIASAAGGATLVGYDWLQPLLEFSRPQKIHAFIFVAVGFLVVGAMIAGFSFQKKQPVTA